MRKKWNLFVRFGVVLTSIFVICVTTLGNTENTSAVDVCTSGQTYASNGLSLALYGGAVPRVINGWWTQYSDTNSLHIQRLVFDFPTASPGYYTLTWSEMIWNPQNNQDMVSSIAGGPGITVLDVDVATVETDGNLYYSYYATIYKNDNSQQFSIAQDIQVTAKGGYTWTVTAPLATYYTCNGGTTESILSSIKSSVDTNNTLTQNIRDILLVVSDTRLTNIEDILRNISINGSSAGVVDKLDEMDDKDDQDRDNLEQQSSDTQDSADDSQSDAESTGTTLLSAFTAFVGALTNANPSNCNIDMDLGNLDLGVVNFCQLSPPAGFATLASIFMILFCVPLSIATARKVINLFRSFQE